MQDDLDSDQLRVLDAVKSGRNVFFTGPAGTGKSHVIAAIAGTDPRVCLTALTGVAAININGRTLHSFMGVGLAQANVETLVESMNGGAVMRVKRARVLIVDEVSMLSDTLFEKLEAVARMVRGNERPFGGIQIVFVGDFFQIPPVSKNEACGYCFESSLWNEMNFECVLLKVNHRQVEPILVHGLAAMRLGVLDEDFRTAVCTPKDRSGPIKPTKLVGTNLVADKINRDELAALPGPKIVFTSKEAEYERGAMEHVKGEKTLTLCVGVQVVHLYNDDANGLCNGSRGVVTGFKDDLPEVLFLGKTEPITIRIYKFDVVRDGRTLAYRQCIPLRLAFAITIHRSQSLTIDLLEVDCIGMFTASQAYVALSRARTMAGLFVKNLDQGQVWVDPRVVAFYEKNKE